METIDTAIETELACIAERQGIAVMLLGSEFASLNFDTLAELEQCLLDGIDRSTVGLLVDLSETRCIGCSFLNVLIRCHARARKMGRTFEICGANSLPGEVFVVTLLDSLWDVFRSLPAAIEAMSRPANNDQRR